MYESNVCVCWSLEVWHDKYELGMIIDTLFLWKMYASLWIDVCYLKLHLY